MISSEQARDYEKYCVGETVRVNIKKMDESINSVTTEVNRYLSADEIMNLLDKEEECQDD